MGIGEALTFVMYIGTIGVAKLKFKKDVTGMYMAGLLLGITVEYLTESYWDYHFKVSIWRDVPLYIIIGWSYSFTIFISISNAAYKKITGKQPDGNTGKGLLLCDAILGPIWFVPLELFAINGLHLWNISEAARWTHIIPWIHYPWEGVIGAALFALVLPTFVRRWESELRFK